MWPFWRGLPASGLAPRDTLTQSSGWQGWTRPETLLGYTYSNMPGAFGPAYGVSPPSVKFHVTQQLPTGPHPMTTDALVTSNNAESFAQAVENTEREDKQRIDDVSYPCVAVADINIVAL